ncbi:MAG TPA: glycerophosphoryl diester phosphodiesterase membrane domain-containing protein [Mycobacteriales bacterium]|nr:glycerophosphoryl diester phosphodiesterase membrane domain-containing protein [Mycobacteriales bacterium]
MSDDPTGGSGYPPPPGWVPPGAAPPPGYPPPGYPPPGYPPPGYPPPGYPPPGAGWPHAGGGWGVPQAPKPGIVPLRPLGLGELLDGGFALIRRYPAATLGLSAGVMFVVEAVRLIVTYFVANGASLDATSLSSDGTETINGDALARVLTLDIVVVVVTLAATVVLTGMLTAVVGPAVLGNRVTAADAWRDARPLMARLLGASLAVMVIVAGGVLACAAPGLLILVLGAAAGAGPAETLGAVLAVIGGIGGVVLAFYLEVSLAFTTQVVMLEKQPVRTALRRSRALVKGSWWRIFGITLLAGIIAQVVAAVVGFPFSLAGAIHSFSSFSDSQSVNFSFTDLLLTGIGGLLGATISRPFAAGVTALVYIDQRMRREALDLTLQQAVATPAS